jgi:hypothetical protein
MIYGTSTGKAGVFSLPGLPAVIHLEGFSSGLTSALLSVGFSQNANVQFMHSLQGVIYVYSFGERMGTIEVNGVSFIRPCSGVMGLGQAFSYYKTNSVSRRDTPITVSVGTAHISGFVVGINSTFSDSQNGMMGFSIQIASLPIMWGGTGEVREVGA